MKTCKHKLHGHGWDENGKWREAKFCDKPLPFQMKNLRPHYESEYCEEHRHLYEENKK